MGKPSRKPRHCEVCGREYRPTYRDQRTCGRACGLELQYRKGRNRKAPQASRIFYCDCVQCGVLFVARREKQRACNKECGKRFALAKLNAKHQQQAAIRTAIYRTCPECSRAFVANERSLQQQSGRLRRFCSRRCSVRWIGRQHGRSGDHRERARRLGVAYEPINPQEIYERDGWRCQLCRRRVSRKLKYPHLMCASLDCIIPMSLGGGFVKANVQLAHFLCNSLKRDSGIESGEQLRLIG